VARALVVAARALPFLALAAIGWTKLTEDAWRQAPLDDAGFTTAWAPNLSVVLVGLTVAASPFILLPIASSALAQRVGTVLEVRTVLGRRTVDLMDARTWRARVPGRGWGLQVVVVRSGIGWAVLTASEVWLSNEALLATRYQAASVDGGHDGVRSPGGVCSSRSGRR
jgi:hypothetical protein